MWSYLDESSTFKRMSYCHLNIAITRRPGTNGGMWSGVDWYNICVPINERRAHRAGLRFAMSPSGE